MILEPVEKESKEIVFVYTTCSSTEEARLIGLSCVNEKFAISVDYWFINSIYPWNNVVHEVDQVMIMLATKKELSEELINHIETIHPYHIPMIARTDVTLTNHLYSSWVLDTLSKKDEFITEEEEANKIRATEFHDSRLK